MIRFIRATLMDELEESAAAGNKTGLRHDSPIRRPQ
jgi:hypothetical protein